jgi:hypothetical protein
MASSKSPAPAPSPAAAPKQDVAPYTIDANGNITVTGSITGDQLRQAQEEAKTIKQQTAEANKDRAIYGNESVADVQAREAQTLANPKKARVRGRRSLVSDPIGGGGSREALG